MKPFPFELEGVFFLHTNVQAIHGYVPDAEISKLSPNNKVTVMPDAKDNQVFYCQMHTTFNEGRSNTAPYFIDILGVAKMRVVDASMSSDEIRRGLTITGHNVVYGAIREAVSWITGRHINGPLLLGLSVLQRKTEAEAKAAAEEGSSQP